MLRHTHINDTVDLAITAAADPACVLLDTAVAHRYEDVEHGLF